MIFELAEDLRRTLESLPAEHAARRTIDHLDEALRRHAAFLERRPTALFQCLQNEAWWPGDRGTDAYYAEGEDASEHALKPLLESWYAQVSCLGTVRPWLRARRPPARPLGYGAREVLDGHMSEVHDLDVRSGAIASSGGDGVVIWDARTLAERKKLWVHGVRTAVLLDDLGDQVLCGLDDGRVERWDARDVELIESIQAHESRIRGLALTRDGRRLATASDDGRVRIWSLNPLAELACLQREESRPRRPVSDVSWSADGRYVVSGEYFGAFLLWDGASGELLVEEFWDVIDVPALDFAPQGTLVAAACGESVVLWCAEQRREVARLTGSGRVIDVRWSADGQQLVTAHDGQEVRAWKASDRSQTARISGFEDSLSAVAFTYDGRRVVCAESGYYGHEPRIVVRDRHWREERPPRLIEPTDYVRILRYSREGAVVATGTLTPNGLRLWDGLEGHESVRVPRNFGQVKSVSMSPTAPIVAAAGGSLAFFSLDYLKGELHVYEGHEDTALSVAFSHDGQRLASGGKDGTIRIWRVGVGSEERCLVELGPLSRLHDLCWSRSGKRICGLVSDAGICVVAVETGEVIAKARRPNDVFRCDDVRFTEDDRLLIEKHDGCWELDEDTGEWQRISEGLNKIDASADGIWALKGGTLIHLDSGSAAAWWPTPLLYVAVHPSAWSWAGTEGRHLHVISVEDASDIVCGAPKDREAMFPTSPTARS